MQRNVSKTLLQYWQGMRITAKGSTLFLKNTNTTEKPQEALTGSGLFNISKAHHS